MDQVDGASRRVIVDAGFGEFYTHSVGHHVGLNVHDPGRSPLEPGMVVTIEPGIYVPEGADVEPTFFRKFAILKSIGVGAVKQRRGSTGTRGTECRADSPNLRHLAHGFSGRIDY